MRATLRSIGERDPAVSGEIHEGKRMSPGQGVAAAQFRRQKGGQLIVENKVLEREKCIVHQDFTCQNNEKETRPMQRREGGARGRESEGPSRCGPDCEGEEGGSDHD